jgi:hypothetical protein
VPDVDFAFLADAAETIPGQKFHVLGGGISRIAGLQFPLRQPHLALVVGLIVAPGEVEREHELSFSILGPDGSDVANGTGSIVPHASGEQRDALLTFSVDLWNVTFPSPGEYSVSIRVNGSERKRLPLVLGRRAPLPGEAVPPEFSAPPGATDGGRIA